VRMTAAEVARAVGGRLEGAAEVVLRGAEVDSRRLEPGDLFVALAGARRDGHEFVAAALAVAGAALVRGDATLDPPPPGRALIRVQDPLTAHWHLAGIERRRRPWRVAAVTGSVAKTTVKEFLAHVTATRLRVGSTSGNRNSTLGLPSELLSQPEGVELFVAEAGMSRSGELDSLGAILAPLAVLVYTIIAPAHTAFFASMDAVVAAKAELLHHLGDDGTLVVNAADPLQAGFPDRVRARVLPYGAPSSPAHLEAVDDRGLLGTRFELVLPEGRAEVELSLPGRHQADNVLAAAAGAAALGLTTEEIAGAAATLEAAPRRGRLVRLRSDITLVDDTYNASPLAVRRLLHLLARAPGRRVAVLGEMYELGELAAEAHRAAGTAAAGACDLLVVVGGVNARELAGAARAAGLDAVEVVADAGAASERLGRLLEPGDVVLVKGSRGVGLDRTVDDLVGSEAA